MDAVNIMCICDSCGQPLKQPCYIVLPLHKTRRLGVESEDGQIIAKHVPTLTVCTTCVYGKLSEVLETLG